MLPDAEQMLEQPVPPSDVKQNQGGKSRNQEMEESSSGLWVSRLKEYGFFSIGWGAVEFTRSFLQRMTPQTAELWFLEEPGTRSFTKLCLDLQTPSISTWAIILDLQIADYPQDKGFYPILPFAQAAGVWCLSSTLKCLCHPKQCIYNHRNKASLQPKNPAPHPIDEKVWMACKRR